MVKDRLNIFSANDTRWHTNELRDRLITQHKEYSELGLDHPLYPETDDSFYSQWLHHRLTILSIIPEECRKAATKVIDIGGGKGRLSALLSELGLYCTDIDCLFMERDIQSVSGEYLIPKVESYLSSKGVTVIAHDFYSNGIPLPDNEFNLAILSEVIEHLPNSPKPLLSELRRILIPGGWLVLTTPNQVSIRNRINFLRGLSYREPIQTFFKMEGYPLGTVYRGHTREYTMSEIEYMLAEEGFQIAKAITCNYGPKVGKMRLVASVCKRLFDDMDDFIIVLARKHTGLNNMQL